MFLNTACSQFFLRLANRENFLSSPIQKEADSVSWHLQTWKIWEEKQGHLTLPTPISIQTLGTINTRCHHHVIAQQQLHVEKRPIFTRSHQLQNHPNLLIPQIKRPISALFTSGATAPYPQQMVRDRDFYFHGKNIVSSSFFSILKYSPVAVISKWTSQPLFMPSSLIWLQAIKRAKHQNRLDDGMGRASCCKKMAGLIIGKRKRNKKFKQQ